MVLFRCDSNNVTMNSNISSGNKRRRSISYSSSESPSPSLALSIVSSVDDVYTPTCSPPTKKSNTNLRSSWYEHIPSLAEEAYVQGLLEESALQADLAERNAEEMLYVLTHMTNDDDHSSFQSTTTHHSTTTTTTTNYPQDVMMFDSISHLSNINLCNTFDEEDEFETLEDEENEFETFEDEGDRMDIISNNNTTSSLLFSGDDDVSTALTYSSSTSTFPKLELVEMNDDKDNNVSSLIQTTVLDDNKYNNFEREMISNINDPFQQSHTLPHLTESRDDCACEEKHEDDEYTRVKNFQKRLLDIETALAQTKEMENIITSLSQQEQHTDNIDDNHYDPQSRWYAQYSRVTGIFYFQPSTGKIVREEPETYCDTSSVRRGPEEIVRGNNKNNYIDTNNQSYNATTTNKDEIYKNLSFQNHSPQSRRKFHRGKKCRSTFSLLLLPSFIVILLLLFTYCNFNHPFALKSAQTTLLDWKNDTFNNDLSQALSRKILDSKFYTTILSTSTLPIFLAL
uniref:Uncharacterized protein n=1 Tax=Eucampia antarctica TaxID=49252 RepID=A0A7S2SEJ3_9STRA|mmetsp:Transcript_7092/g.6721  ORF Transcript_7092/g.6721 Transcript_7092/m.6721 type:complete len:512 (+) Transcript_7092:44-1579(+)